MNPQLTEPIKNYFNGINHGDSRRVKDCFIPDAFVLDEGRRHQGREAIVSWVQESREKYQFSARPIGVTTKGLREVVVVEVSGNFPGSPTQLTHAFILNKQKIQSLEIF